MEVLRRTLEFTLPSSIRMVHQAIGGASLAQCHIERGLRQVLFHTRAHRPADDFSGIQVHDYGQIQPSLARRNVGDIGYPLFIGAIG
jgi:hypothetical protein